MDKPQKALRAQELPTRLPLICGYMAFPQTTLNTLPLNVGTGLDLVMSRLPQSRWHFILAAYDEGDTLPSGDLPGILCRLDERSVTDDQDRLALSFTPLQRVRFKNQSRLAGGGMTVAWTPSPELNRGEVPRLQAELREVLRTVLEVSPLNDDGESQLDDLGAALRYRDPGAMLAVAASAANIDFDEFNALIELDVLDDRFRFVIAHYNEVVQASPLGTAYRRLNEPGLPERVRDAMREQMAIMKDPTIGQSDRQAAQAMITTIMSVPWVPGDAVRVHNPTESREILDASHAGADDLKSAILDEVYTLNWLDGHHQENATPLLLVGPPGIGKTSMLYSMAKVLNRRLEVVSCSAITDAQTLIGSQKVWVGSQLGLVMRRVIKAGTSDIILAFDEVDKFSANPQQRDALWGVLMQLTDKTRNHDFVDQFLGLPFDASRITIVATANNISEMPEALLNRFRTVPLRGYSDHEKVEIAKKHLIPNLRSEKRIGEDMLEIPDAMVKRIVSSYDRESGVRELSHLLETVFARALREVVDGGGRVVLDKNKMREYLGSPMRDLSLAISHHVLPGTGDVLTVGEDGTGYIEHVQVCLLPIQDGQTVITGSVSEQYRESIIRARDYVVARHAELGLDEGDAVQLISRHLHVSQDGIGREIDGSSGGVSLVLAMLSYLYREPWPDDLVATGALELHGGVSAVGGIPEKLTAAARLGKRRVLIPAKNVYELEKVAGDTLAQLQITPINSIEEAVAITFPGHPSTPNIPLDRAQLRVLDPADDFDPVLLAS